MNKVLEKNFKKHCKIALLSYLSKIDCKNAKNQQILGFVCTRRRRRRKKAILKLLLRKLKTLKNVLKNTNMLVFFYANVYILRALKKFWVEMWLAHGQNMYKKSKKRAQHHLLVKF